MATALAMGEPFVSVEEYLSTVYEADMDYVDGVLEDRNVGEFGHATVQQLLMLALMRFEDEAGVLTIIETRTQTQVTRFRVPDVALLSTERLPDRIVRSAPLLCIEVMSPEDRLSRIRTKCEDYLHMGVPAVWIFDLPNETAYQMTAEEFTEVRNGWLRLDGTPVALDVQEIYVAAKKRAGRLA